MPYKYKQKRQEYMKNYRTPYMREYRHFKKEQMEEVLKVLQEGKAELAKQILERKPSISIPDKTSDHKPKGKKQK